MKEQEDSKYKIEIHLDSRDFRGFIFRLLEIILPSLVLSFFTKLDIGFFILAGFLFSLIYYGWKITQFREGAYRNVLRQRDEKIAFLEKQNRLQANMLKDKNIEMPKMN